MVGSHNSSQYHKNMRSKDWGAVWNEENWSAKLCCTTAIRLGCHCFVGDDVVDGGEDDGDGRTRDRKRIRGVRRGSSPQGIGEKRTWC